MLQEISRDRPAYAFEQIERAARKTGSLLEAPPHADYSIEALPNRGHRLIILDADMPLICACDEPVSARRETCIVVKKIAGNL